MFAAHGMLAAAAGGVGTTPEENFEVTDSLSTTANLASYTLSGASIGDADDSRIIYVAAIFSHGSNGTPTCTVGGTSLAIVNSNLNNGVNNHSVVLFSGQINAAHGATADVVVTPAGTAGNMGFVVCASYNNSNGATATDTAGSTTNSISGLVVDTGGIGICAFYAQANVSSASFTNATEIFVFGTSANCGGAVGKLLGASTATITCDLSPSNSGKYSIAAAFR